MKNSKFIKWTSFVLALIIVLGSMPVSSNSIAFAAEGDGIAIQYLSGSVIQSGVEIEIRPDDSSEERYSGVTDENGVWQTPVSWADLTELFYVYIDGSPKSVTKSETSYSYLIVNDDEKSWANNVLGIVSVTVNADKTSVLRSETISLTATVKGTPEKYQWYFNSQEIKGATSSVYVKENAAVADSGRYSCRVTDIYGDSRTSDGVTVTVSEKDADGVSLKAFANGSEINGFISRDVVKEVKLNLSGLPDDASVKNVKYYVNGICRSSETAETSFTFKIEDGVEIYECEAEVTFDKYYATERVSLATPIQAAMLQQDSIIINVIGVEYNEATGSYDLTYSASPKASFSVAVSGGSGTGVYSLKVVEEKKPDGTTTGANIASISADGQNLWRVTVKNAGSFRIEASKAGDGDYKEVTPVQVVVNVSKANPEGFAFETASPEAVTFNANGNEFTNQIVEGFSGVEYSIDSGDCAEIDKDTGKLTIKKAGTVKVKATLAENDNYSEATAIYELTINKAVQTIEFEDKAESIYYGESYSRAANPVEVAEAADGYGYNRDENAKIRYSVIVADGEEAIAAVKEDGSLEFVNQKLGTVKVKAELDENDCYEAAQAVYTLTVLAYTVENAYEISGDKLVTDSDWYSNDITITPKENHLISKSNNLGEENEWAESIVISTEGNGNGCTVYVKNTETGAVSEANEIPDEKLLLDKSGPYDLKVNYKTEAWYEDVFEITSFGYYNSVIAFTLEAEDDHSGIDYFIWKLISENDDTVEVPESRVEATKDGDKYVSENCVLGSESNLQDFRGRISFSAYDLAGNTAEMKEKYVVVIDAADPVLGISSDSAPVCSVNNTYPYVPAEENTDDVVEVFNKKTTLTLSVAEKNFFKENVTVTVNGEDVTDSLSWESANDNNYTEIVFDKDGDYKVELTYKDIFGEDINNAEIKKTYTESKQICIDTTAPVVSFEISEADFETADAKYYSSDVTVKITVSEEKFRPADIVISDVDGLNGMSSENKEYIRQSDSWIYDAENNTYSASVTFSAENADKEYGFSIDYSDPATNVAEQVNSGVFVIDTVNPEASISTAVEPASTVTNAYPYENAEKNAESSIDIYNDDVDVIFTVIEKNFFADRATVTVNGEDVSGDLEWTTEGEKNTAVLTFSEKEDYSIVLTYTDIFGNTVENKTEYEVSELISVDETKPEITIELSEERTENEEIKYYNGNVIAKITVAEEKFRPADLVISDIDGYNGISEENKQYLLNSQNWNYDEDNNVYTASVVFVAENAEGTYKFAVDYADLAQNAADQAVSETFNIDITAPVISVDYNDARILNSDNIAIDSFDIKDSNSVTVFDNKDIVVTVRIDEQNFDPEKASVMLSKNFGEEKSYEFDGEWKSEESVHTNTVTLKEKDVYKLKFTCTDRGTNVSQDHTTPKIVISDTVPSITFDVLPESESSYYNSESVKITVKVFDEYFAQENVDIKIEVEDIYGKKIAISDAIPDYKNTEWTVGENFCNSIELTFETEGRYNITVEYVNAVDDEYKSACDFVLDRTAPTHEVTYSEPYYVTIINSITFNLFNSDKPAKVTVTAKDNISGVDRMKVEYPNEYLPEDYYGTESFVTEMVFYADDTKADAAELSEEWYINSEDASVQAKANIGVTATDNANNTTAEEDRVDDEIVAIDTVPSTISLSYGDAKILDAKNNVVDSIDENQSGSLMIYDKKAITVTVSVKEPNFNPDGVVCELTSDAIPGTKQCMFNGEWETDGIIHTNTVTIDGEGVYKLKVSNTDLANNKASYDSLNMVINEKLPNIRFEFSPARVAHYYNEPVTVTIRIFDEYFSADRSEITVIAKDAARREFSAQYDESGVWSTESTENGIANIYTLTFKNEGMYKVNVKYENAVNDSAEYKQVFAVDFTNPEISSVIKPAEDGGNEDDNHAIITIIDENFNIDNFDKPAYGSEDFNAEKLDTSNYDFMLEGFDIGDNHVYTEAERAAFVNYFKNAENWTSVWKNGVYENTLTISDLREANHKIEVSGNDRALNSASDSLDETVDHSAPYDIKIKYSDPVSIGKTVNGKTESEVRYYNDKIKVTITAEDSIAGVTQFDWVYARSSDASGTNVETLKGTCHLDSAPRTAVAEFYLPADKVEAIRGNLTVRATDKKGNTSEAYTDKTTLVIDNTKPEVNFEFSPSDPKMSDGGFPEGGAGYYDSAVTVSVYVKESNFVAESKTIINTNGSAYDGVVITCNEERINGIWKKNGDTWRTDIELSNDDSYVIKAEYTDPSGNTAEAKETGEIVIDRNAPEIKVEYSPDKPVYTDGERKYYSEDQIATITITERNFNPADVVASVTVSEIGGNKEAQSDLAAALTDDSAWKQDGDVYTATIKYSDDGNYKFNIEYTDPSGNKAAEYAGSELTIDKNAPTGLSVKFSSEVENHEGTLYYNSPVKVTVTAIDGISGVKSFDYSYTSSVTGKTVKGTKPASSNGAEARAEFYVPGSEAEQFKGTVKVTATDNSGNTTSSVDGSSVIVCDDIAPRGEIDIGSSVTNINGVSYFSDSVNAAIRINESNFDGDDVIVLVDGKEVSVGPWTSNGDDHTADIYVSSDGEHTISVTYTDKSGNQMETVEPEYFVIDHSAPVILVSGVKNNAAYSEDEISFTITAKDENLDSRGLDAELTVVVQNDNGSFETKKIDIEGAYSSSNGYAISVENLDEDGIYTLTSKASDLCGNVANGISSDGKTESSITFSVNRKGSTFHVDEATKNLVDGSQYTQDVKDNIVITEINVAPIESHSVKLNGVELEEGVDYDVKPEGAEGEWYKYTYTIYAKNFAEENDYSIVISSTDGTKNTGYSDLKGRPIEFTVDKTAPTVSVSGVEANGSYKTDKLAVRVVPFDAGGMISKFEVFADDELLVSYTSEELMNLLADSADGAITVEIAEGSYDRIRFVCTDEAGNIYDSEDTYKDVTVSPNQLVLLWSKDWFKASIIGGIVLAAGLIVLIILKKKKKEE